MITSHWRKPASARREQEEGRLAAPEGHPEPPDGGTSAEKAQRLWILRALRQTSYVSHMSREVCDDSTKADWSIWSYREFRRLLDEEMMAVCRIYAEVELADPPVREGKEAKGWQTSAHKDAECAPEHIGARVKEREGLGALLHPDMADSSPHVQRRRARGAAFVEAKSASACSQKKDQGAADWARRQASRTPERDPARPHAPHGTEMDLVDRTSESDTSDPGGVPQLFRRSSAPDTPSQRTQQAAPVPNKPPEGNNEFAQELASTMSTITSLDINASGRSVSNRGWLYFSGASKDFCPFRTKCRLF